MHAPNPDAMIRENPRLAALIGLCADRLGATEVWLFGSRARGDHRPDSDWDLLAVIPDSAPPEAEDPVALFRLRRESGLHADLFSARETDFALCKGIGTTLAGACHDHGVPMLSSWNAAATRSR